MGLPGRTVGCGEGMGEGPCVGDGVGLPEGWGVGRAEGCGVGPETGTTVGNAEGIGVGFGDGRSVGFALGRPSGYHEHVNVVNEVQIYKWGHTDISSCLKSNQCMHACVSIVSKGDTT